MKNCWQSRDSFHLVTLKQIRGVRWRLPPPPHARKLRKSREPGQCLRIIKRRKCVLKKDKKSGRLKILRRFLFVFGSLSYSYGNFTKFPNFRQWRCIFQKKQCQKSSSWKIFRRTTLVLTLRSSTPSCEFNLFKTFRTSRSHWRGKLTLVEVCLLNTEKYTKVE